MKSALPQLEKLARDPKNEHALDALFALQMLGGLDDNLAMDLLKHPDPYVRRWVVRCTGDMFHRGRRGAPRADGSTCCPPGATSIRSILARCLRSCRGKWGSGLRMRSRRSRLRAQPHRRR